MPLIGTPANAANSVYWTSREAQPGKMLAMTGAFTAGTKTVKIAWIPPGTLDWSSVLSQSSQTVTPTQIGTTGLSFRIPDSLPTGIYAYELDDTMSQPLFGMINVPHVDWLAGIPADNSTPLLHGVLSCVAEAGQQLALVGSDFSTTVGVHVQAADGTAYALPVAAQSNTMLTANVPASLPSGPYSLWVGDDVQGASSSTAVPLTVIAPRQMSVQHIACSGLSGDGVTDNSPALQSCFDTYQPSEDQIFLFDLPPGAYLLKQGLAPHSRQVLSGSSPALTTLLGSNTPGTAVPAWIMLPTYFAMQGLTLKASAAVLPLMQPASTTTTWQSGHVWLNNVVLATSGEQGFHTIRFTGPDIQVYNSTVQSSMELRCANGALVKNNTFNDDQGIVTLGNSQNVLFENNTLTSQTGVSNETVSIAREFVLYGPSYQSRNIHMGGNVFSNVGIDQQVITTDGGGGAYWGPVNSGTSNTVTLGDDPSWNWTGNTNPQDATMVVLSGTGAGQAATIQKYDGRTITLTTPWAVIPDATSIVSIAFYHRNLTIAGNTFTNTRGITINMGDTVNGTIEDNVLTNSGSGILLWGFGPYGGPAGYGSVVNFTVLRNTIGEGEGTDIVNSTQTNTGGIGVFDIAGCVVSGVLIRDNTVTPLQTIYTTDGWEGLNTVIIDGNDANVMMNGAPRTLVNGVRQ